MVKGKLGAKGFSLVELMVVVAIIGILAAVAIPNFQRFQRKARQTEATAMLGGIHAAESAFAGQWENYATNLPVIGYVPDGTLRYLGGFAAALPAPGFSGGILPPDYVNAVGVAAANFDTAGVCVAFPTRCTNGSGFAAGSVLGAVAPAGTGNTAQFTAAARGTIGGALDDRWTITQLKRVLNTQDGTQ